MINALQGIPGSGKSYEACAYHVLVALKQGRKVVTNLPLILEAWAAIDPSYIDLIEVRTQPEPIRGTWNASNIAKNPAFQIVEGMEEVPADDVPVFGHVWDFYSTWRDDKDRGPLYVVDECHVPFPKIGTQKSVVEWFKLHRHFNADVLLMTQNFRDMDQPIAGLIAILVKCRKADVLGKSDSYIRKVHAGYRGGEVSKEIREYKRQYFGLYKSNTQSNGSSEGGMSDVSPMIVKFNRFKWAVLALAIGVCVWAFWPKPGYGVFGNKLPTSIPAYRELQPATPAQAYGNAPIPEPAAPAQQAPVAPPAQTAATPAHPPAAAPQPAVQDPLFGKLLHMTGDMSKKGRAIMTFVVSQDGRRLFELTSDDLNDAGYKVKRLANCMVTVQFEGVTRPVTCDAPYYASGAQNKPLVIEAGTGGRSYGPRDDAGPVELPREVKQQQQQQVDGYLESLAKRNAQVRSVFAK